MVTNLRRNSILLAAKDLSKINEGEVKDYSVGATELKLTGTIYARLVKSVKTRALQA